ncbi:MAG: phosphatidylserine decarboxylase [Cyclobacteriaceae bacterium]
MTFLLLLESVLVSTLLYLYLHKKTRISLKYLGIDNVAVIIVSFLISYWVLTALPEIYYAVAFIVNFVLVGAVAFAITMIRFWRTPTRKAKAAETDIISPADGNVIYVEKVEAGEVPVSVKGNTFSKLDELTKTDILSGPCWLVGINMTPFDVHKNCAPIPGRVILNQHFDGKFLSLKLGQALKENERQTMVFDNNGLKIGIVQIASKLVRRIDTYVKEGDMLNRGQWVGMIRFGSQVDVIIPRKYNIQVKVKDQIYAGESIIAKL